MSGSLGKAILVYRVLFGTIYVFASWFVRERERSYAERCYSRGDAAYEYVGISGGGLHSISHLERCTCTNAGGTPSFAPQ